jgi:hypothetical protein
MDSLMGERLDRVAEDLRLARALLVLIADRAPKAPAMVIKHDRRKNR